ncbi:hypothetical protein ACLMJK_000758 [Lecanora helva]
MTSPSKPSNPQPHILRLLPQTLSKTTQTIAHLTRLLSSTSHLDTFLLTAAYTLHLLHAILTRSPRTSRLRLTSSLAPLTNLLDEYRTLLRLFGLLGIYSGAAKLYLAPPPDKDGRITRALTWAQLASIAAFQGLENGAFLAEKGIIGWGEQTIGWAYKWGARCWMSYVGLELVKLGIEGGRLRKELQELEEVQGGDEKMGEGEEKDLVLKEDKEIRKRKWDDFYRRFGVSAAYAPMTVHYSIENGPLSEGSIGALGVVVAWLTFGKAWRESA